MGESDPFQSVESSRRSAFMRFIAVVINAFRDSDPPEDKVADYASIGGETSFTGAVLVNEVMEEK